MTPELKVLIDRQQICEAVIRLACEIREDYKDSRPLLLGILKGAFVFMADLVRQLDIPLDMDFIRLSSYGSARESSGKVTLVQGLKTPLKGRHVLIIEDIIDTGLTISWLAEHLKKKKPASLRLCALADKPSRRLTPVTIDYLGFSIPDKFIVGYGIDWDERYRYLPDICYVNDRMEEC